MMGTLAVAFVLVAAVAAIIASLVRNKKKGKSSCGGNCAHCHGSCHAGMTEKGLHTTTLEIDGMMCSMCESHVNDAIRNNFRVKSVKSSHKTGICTVASEETLDTSALAKTLKEIGYELVGTSSTD